MHGFFVEQMAMYSSYHRDARNRATHFVGVPMIAFSLLIPAALWAFAGSGTIALTFAVVVFALVGLFWIVLDPPIGLLTVLFFLPFLWLAHWIAQQGGATAWIAFAVLFVAGWIIQLVGHYFEGRKPALTDNLLQIFIAPVFLMAEVLFALGLRKRLEDEVEARWRHYAAPERKGEAPAGV